MKNKFNQIKVRFAALRNIFLCLYFEARMKLRKLTGAVEQEMQQQQTEIWPAVSGATPGYVAKGKTTIMWGSNATLSTPFPSGGGFYTVTKASQKPIQDRTKLPNGNGVTTSDVMITDGVSWDLTVRDDSTFTPPLTNTTVTVVDLYGYLGNAGLVYIARVLDSNYETGIKQAGERGIQLENLLLVDSQNSSNQTAR